MKDALHLQIEDEPGRQAHPLWYAPLRPEKFRLVGAEIPKNPRVFSYEIYESLIIPGEKYARVNLQPTDSCVWTIVVGAQPIIGRYAEHDHKLAVPKTDALIYDAGVPLLYTSEANAYPALAAVLDAPNCFYYIRPSSFALSHVKVLPLFGQEVKIVTMQYMLGSGRRQEFFAHIHTMEEKTWLTPMFRALLLTNSQTYIWNHPEFDYSLIHPSQNESVYNTLR